jgi:hypothetical protein
MPKTIRIPAQETVTIYRRNFSSLVMDIPFDAVALNEEAPKGEVTIQGSNWVFPKPTVTQPLQPHNQVRAGFWDTFFSIRVTAHVPVEITLPGRGGFPFGWLIGAIAIGVAVMVGAVAIFLAGT